jgi:cell wall-associated NlpC family hydrolase
VSAPHAPAAAPRTRTQNPAGRQAGSRTATPRTATPRTATPRTATRGTGSPRRTTAQRTSTPRAGAARAGRPRTRTAGKGRPPVRNRRPVRTPRTFPTWWSRLAVLAGTTLALVGLLAALTQPPTGAGLVAPADPTSSPQAAAGTLADAAARHRAALADAERFEARARQARAAAEQARAESTVDRQTVGRAATAAYQRTTTERWPLAALSLHAPEATADVLHGQGLAEQLGAEQDRVVGRAALSALRVAQYTDQVTAARAAADAARQEAAAVLTQVRALVAELDPALTAGLAGLATGPVSPAQQARNAAAVAGWQAGLTELAAAGLTPPPAADLTDPTDLPDGLAPLRDAAGAVVPGVAAAYVAGRTVPVLPAETVAAVSAGLAQLGRPFVPGQAGPDAYDCAGLTATAWAQGGYGLPGTLAGQWSAGTPVPAGQLQVGDLVFSTDPRTGLDDVGLYLGGTSVLSASADLYQVAVRERADLRSAVRVTLTPGAPTPAPAGALPPTCSAPPSPTASGGPTGAWGGFTNGQVPRDQLCALGVAPHRLRCDAAAAYTAMSAAYELTFGDPLCITDSYRSLDAQVDAHHRKPRITAVPGSSNHGWGLAVDLCGGINVFGTAQTAWMTANAARYGWVHPTWAQASGANPEPWHWEFGRLG